MLPPPNADADAGCESHCSKVMLKTYFLPTLKRSSSFVVPGPQTWSIGSSFLHCGNQLTLQLEVTLPSIVISYQWSTYLLLQLWSWEQEH